MYKNPLDYRKKIILKPNKTILYFYFLDKEHPLASKPDGIVYFHRHVASLIIGRWITSKEVVHHIDGDRQNNEPENLQVMSPSEHTKIHRTNSGTKPFIVFSCLNCEKEFISKHVNRRFCSIECSSKTRIKFVIEPEILLDLVWQYPTTEIAMMFGVSDNSIGKRCKKFDIEKPPRGYWQKLARLNRCRECQVLIISSKKHCEECWPKVRHLYNKPPIRKKKTNDQTL